MNRHPLSAMWGDWPEEDFEALKAAMPSYRKADLVLVRYEGMVLDGWHRYRAATETGRGNDIMWMDYSDHEPFRFVCQRNIRGARPPSQRALAVVENCEWAEGGTPPGRGAGLHPYPTTPLTNAEMAALAGVSVRTIQNAKAAVRSGQADEVRAGETSAWAAAEAARPEPPPPPPMDEIMDEPINEPGRLSDPVPEQDDPYGLHPEEPGVVEEPEEVLDTGRPKPRPEGEVSSSGPPEDVPTSAPAPTRVEQLEARVQSLTEQLDAAARIIEADDMGMALFEARNTQGELEGCRTLIKNQQAEIREMEASRDYWRREAKRLGWTRQGE